MTVRPRTILLTLSLAFGAASAGHADPAMDAVMKELVPTGTLRVAIAVGPAPSALYALKDSSAGKFRGVTVDLGAAMAKELGVPVVFLPHLASAAMKADEIDCIALSRESLSGLAARIPGSRILDGGFLNSTTAVAVPKGKSAALAYVSQFVEEAKSAGLVRKAFDDMNLKNSQVAPAGMKP